MSVVSSWQDHMEHHLVHNMTKALSRTCVLYTCTCIDSYLRGYGEWFFNDVDQSNVKNGATSVLAPSVIDRADAETYCNPIG